MSDLPFPSPSTEPKPFDVNHAGAAIGAAIVSIVSLTFRAPGTTPDPADGRALMENIRQALTAGSGACAEVTRMRTELSALRDEHRPRPHADPSKPGALCTTCSVHGSIVAWPCATWTAAERILTHGKA